MKLQTDAPSAQCARPQEVTSHEQDTDGDVRHPRQEQTQRTMVTDCIVFHLRQRFWENLQMHKKGRKARDLQPFRGRCAVTPEPELKN